MARYTVAAATLVAAACWTLDRSRARLSLGLSGGPPLAYLGSRTLLYCPPPDSLDLLCEIDQIDPSEMEQASPSQVEQFVRAVDTLAAQHSPKFEPGVWSSLVPQALLPIIGPKISVGQFDKGASSLFARCMNRSDTLSEKLSRLRALIDSATEEQRTGLTRGWRAGVPLQDSTLFYTLEFGLWRGEARIVTESQFRWLSQWLRIKRSAAQQGLSAAAPAA